MLDDPATEHALYADLMAVMADASICGLGQAASNCVRHLMEHFPEEMAEPEGGGAPVATGPAATGPEEMPARAAPHDPGPGQTRADAAADPGPARPEGILAHEPTPRGSEQETDR